MTISTEGNAAQREVKAGLLLLESTWKILLPRPFQDPTRRMPHSPLRVHPFLEVWLCGLRAGVRVAHCAQGPSPSGVPAPGAGPPGATGCSGENVSLYCGPWASVRWRTLTYYSSLWGRKYLVSQARREVKRTEEGSHCYLLFLSHAHWEAVRGPWPLSKA